MTLGAEVIETIKAGDILLIQTLYSEHVNECFGDGRTPLIVAIQSHQLSVVKALIELGAKPDAAWKRCVVNPWNPALMIDESCYPLQVALDEQWLEGVEFLLTQCGATESHCKDGVFGLLQRLVGWDCVDLVRQLVTRLKEMDLFCISSMTKFTPFLLTAVQQRSLAMVELLVALGVNVNSAHEDMLPLTVAANMQDLPLCIGLMKLGAHLGVQSSGLRNGYVPNPVALAIQVGWFKAAEFLLNLGADPNCEVSWSTMVYTSEVLESGSRLLHLAVAKHRLDAVNVVVKHGATILNTDSSQNNPLHVACKDRHIPLEIVKYLLDSDVFPNRSYVNAKNKQGQTPLLCCCNAGNHQVAKLLLKQKVDINVFDREGKSCLHHAVQSRSEALVLLLLRHNVNVNIRHRKHASPLQLAVGTGDETIVKILLDYKADLHGSSTGKQSMLHLAVESRNDVLVESLLRLDLNVDSLNDLGVTSLMQAASAGSAHACRLLIGHRASLNLCSKHNRETALMMAIYYGLEENAQVLVSEGACLMTTDKGSITPLHSCFHNTRPRSLQLLLLAGLPITFMDLLKYPQTLPLLKCPDFVQWLFHHITHPRTLQDLCVLRLRRYLKTQSRGKGIGKLVRELPLPEKLRGCVMLEHFELQEFELQSVETY